MAIDIRINTIGGARDFSLFGNPTVADLKSDADSGYQAGQVVRVNGQDAADDLVIPDGATVSFSTPATKHGNA